jgi:hypothetical protein
MEEIHYPGIPYDEACMIRVAGFMVQHSADQPQRYLPYCLNIVLTAKRKAVTI